MAVVVVLLFIVPLLIPLSAYTKQAEILATHALGVPVSIGSLRVVLLPSPRLNVADVVVGEQHEFIVADVSVVPVLSTLLSDTKVISRVQLSQPVIKKSALNIVAGLTKKPKDEPINSAVSVHQIVIENAKFDWPDMHLPEINADIRLSPKNKPKAATIKSVDGKLKLELTAENKQQIITLTAQAWTLPLGSPLLIDQLRMDMVLTDNKLDITQINGALYSGQLKGAASLTWGKMLKLTGKAKLDNLSLREPARLMSKSTRVSGLLFSNGQFVATAKDSSQLLDHLHADIKFKVKDGVLYGFDLAKAPAMLLGHGEGGETKFDELSGLLGVSGQTYRFRELKISSGLMKAGGDVKINPNKSLEGEIEVEVKNSMKIAAIPLNITGTLENPKVFPTRSAIAGAVAGTAILGPAGTGLGIKAGKAIGDLKGLFGNTDNRK